MNRRIFKINELLQQELSQLIYDEFSEKYGIITVNRVDTSPDLENSKIFLGLIGKGNSESLIKEINKSQFEFRILLGKKIHLRKMPNFQFYMDDSSEIIMKIDHLIDKIKDDKKS